ncbi:MAG: ankyrin repeat domain-containing protein [Gammaproteobacteria bacterium]|nr:ankyrin repeat domain-containing protein [Gammaproteobacteria bacterium]
MNEIYKYITENDHSDSNIPLLDWAVFCHQPEASLAALNPENISPLCIATRASQLTLVQHFLLEHPETDINTIKDPQGNSLLSLATQAQCPDLVTLFLERGIDVHAPNFIGDTALHYAAIKPNPTLNLLVQAHANIDASSNDGSTPLHFAAETGNLDGIMFLLSSGASVDPITHLRHTPLHLAAYFNQPLAVRTLIVRGGADIHAVNIEGFSAVHLAAVKGHDKVIEYLWRHGAKIDTFNRHGAAPIHTAVYANHRSTLLFFLQKGIPFDTPRADGFTPLMIALEKNYTELARFLLKQDANVMAQSNEGLSCIHLAVLSGKQDMILELLQRGAPVDTPKREGVTPLMLALEQHPETAWLLLAHGASHRTQSQDGRSCLHSAAFGGNCSLITYLLEKNLSVHTQDHEERTPLHFAATTGKIDAINLLLANGATLDARDIHGDPPLSFTLQENHLMAARLLLEKGADANLINKQNKSLLEITIELDQGKLFALLIEFKATVTEKVRQLPRFNSFLTKLQTGFLNTLRKQLERPTTTKQDILGLYDELSCKTSHYIHLLKNPPLRVGLFQAPNPTPAAEIALNLLKEAYDNCPADSEIDPLVEERFLRASGARNFHL